jgi:valyl-tRNA synthetase
MDLRPQSHEIIRTWAFYTIAKAWLHEETIPWHHVAISGWVLDPDRKKMSKSKGNVVTPVHLLDQYGSDAVRYWSLSARLGTDTAFDEKVLKVGRRLVTKIFNASKFVLSQSAPEGGVTRPLDLSFLARLQETVDKASASLEALEYAAALDAVERFFWGGFTDTYVEMVKSRARSETDAEGRASAVAALQLGLKVVLRLLAPYLPYVTEEAWSWGFARTEDAPSIHRAAWPSSEEFARLPSVDGGGAAFDAGCAFLEAVRRGKSGAGATVGRHLARLRIAASPATARLLEPCLEDLVAAARAEGEVLEAREGLEDGSFEIVDLELAEPRPRS